MAKTRVSIPKTIGDAVLKEYRHRCAICARDSPQLHHINENPSDNDRLNLIPLCPNCHLSDQHDPHDPTRPVDPEILRLFRRFKDPTILTPQFLPLFRRTRFLYAPTVPPLREILLKHREFIEFVAALEMGRFYSTRISDLVMIDHDSNFFRIVTTKNLPPDQRYTETAEQLYEKFILQRDNMMELVIELLRYQNWQMPENIGARRVHG